MMAQQNRQNRIIDLAQLLVWVGLFITPTIIDLTVKGSVTEALDILKVSVKTVLPYFFLYIFNYYFLVPYGLHKGRKALFFGLNALFIVAWCLYKFLPRPGFEFPEDVVNQFGEQSLWAFFVAGIFMTVFIQVMIILAAVGIRQIMRNNEMLVKAEEERRKNVEAELTWLKHQLNPHFLFNTLNNISSLTQIDADKAQESIGQLSDLLRYALYDSESDTVPLGSEMEFMDNYVDLMALRCNELAKVTKDIQPPHANVQVAPLLFISLVENAFKHGVNARYPSFVKVEMCYTDGLLRFRCENSVFEKHANDHIGSGIGLENMRRRLELLYPGKYTYKQSVSDGVYSVEVSLSL